MPQTLNLSEYFQGSLHMRTCTQVMMMMMINISRPKQNKTTRVFIVSSCCMHHECHVNKLIPGYVQYPSTHKHPPPPTHTTPLDLRYVDLYNITSYHICNIMSPGGLLQLRPQHTQQLTQNKKTRRRRRRRKCFVVFVLSSSP